MRLVLFLLSMLAVVATRADSNIIGTIEFSLDGEEQTWYVLESPTGLLPNALWMELPENRYALSVTAFDDPDIALVADEITGSAVPQNKAPALVLSVAFPAGASAHSHTLPAPVTDGPAVIMLLNDWSNPIDSYMLSDGPGAIRLTAIDANKASTSSFAGTFNGALKDGDGNARRIESGQFKLTRVTYFKRP